MPPKLVAVALPGQLVVNLTWDYTFAVRPNDVRSRYAVYRKELETTAGGIPKLSPSHDNWIADLSPSLSHYFDTSIKEGHGHIYIISAIGHDRSEAVSNTVFVEPIQLLSDTCSLECVCGGSTAFDPKRCALGDGLQPTNSLVESQVNLSTATASDQANASNATASFQVNTANATANDQVNVSTTTASDLVNASTVIASDQVNVSTNATEVPPSKRNENIQTTTSSSALVPKPFRFILVAVLSINALA